MKNQNENEDLADPQHFIHPRNFGPLLDILLKAGWIKSGGSNWSEAPGQWHAKIHIEPTEAGAERFRAILLLLRELDAIELPLTPHEAALVCRLARTYAPLQDNLAWPSDLPPAMEVRE
jgi:hypothetical protein